MEDFLKKVWLNFKKQFALVFVINFILGTFDFVMNNGFAVLRTLMEEHGLNAVLMAVLIIVACNILVVIALAAVVAVLLALISKN